MKVFIFIIEDMTVCTGMLFDTGLPSIHSVLHNYRVSFMRSWIFAFNLN